MHILHLTDWHLRDNDSPLEALREAYFEEYLHSLLDKLPNPPDCIFITGDIVDKAKFENFSWAKKIIDYLKDFFPSKDIDVFISNGNHDICRKTGCKSSFNEFQKSTLSNPSLIIESNENYLIYKVNDFDAVLMIDSIGPNYANGFPRTLDELEDEIVVKIRSLKLKNLFVLSHHPAVTQLSEFTSSEEENWNKEHIWANGADLSRRLASKPNITGQLFWFAGDIHIAEHVVHDQCRVMFSTGSFYALGVDDGTKLSPNARFIDTTNYETSILFEYKFKTHKGRHLDGEWISNEIEARLSDNVSRRGDLNNKVNETNKGLIEDKSDKQYLLLNDDFEKLIYDEVLSKEFCQHGLNLQSNSKYSQLSWISITSLLSQRETYRNIIKYFRDQIVRVLDEELSGAVLKKDCLFIGVDNWGAIIAARLGAASNIKSCSIAVKNEVSAYEDVEIVNSELKKIIDDKKVLFIISDVIVSGHTVKRVIDELGIKSNEGIYSFTIFFDKDQPRDIDFNNLKGFYYLCGKVKTPFIESRFITNES